MSSKRVQQLRPGGQLQQPHDQVHLGVAPGLERLVHEPEIVLVEDLRPDELVGHAYR
jgi:hypothetical protein